ncbi:MAG: PucR family transcriptional regulator, partial [Solirubrobacterales bacterium]|nr:PucR family transcriptional regulator [Solirubrobacterales bacterium]
MTEEILASIAREVPEYARPLEGSFGRGVQRGVAAALRGFTELLRDPDGQGGAAGDVYVELGRGELRQGRTLDSLQAAYRVGARAAWRRLAQASLRAGVDAQALSLLAEAIFAYIDRISADSVEGYAEAQSEREGERQRHRRRLLAALLAEQPPLEEELARLARDAAWEPPLLAAALACVETDRAALQRRLPAGTLAGTIEGRGCVVVADP